MKKLILIVGVLVFFASSCNQGTAGTGTTTTTYCLYSQNSEFEASRTAIRHSLIRHCYFSDTNPTHQEAADRVNAFVRKVFERQYTDEDVPDLINQAFHLLFYNSRWEFDDTPDVERITVRRSMCFMALAFLSDWQRYRAFLSDAYWNLSQLEPFRGNRMLLLVELIDLYRQLGWVHATRSDLEHSLSLLQDNFKKRKQDIYNEAFIAEYGELLQTIANNIRQM